MRGNKGLWHSRARLSLVALVALVLLLAATACVGTGVYPVDIFYEMHYQQSFEEGEPPRKSSPADAVPITGVVTKLYAPGEVPANNPLPRTQANLQEGARLFAVNCSMCHGAQGKGDGEVGRRLVKWNYAAPPDLTGAPTVNRTDGDIYGIITNGIFVMPSFARLLTPEERWQIVWHLRQLEGR